MATEPEPIPFPTMARSSMGGLTAPQHLPFNFTDDTLMYIAVRVAPSPTSSSPPPPTKNSLNPLKFLLPSKPKNHKEKIKTIRLPRSEYLKYFARDTEGRYVGTEKEREWSEEALQEWFGRYWEERPVKWVVAKGDRGGLEMIEEGRGVGKVIEDV